MLSLCHFWHFLLSSQKISFGKCTNQGTACISLQFVHIPFTLYHPPFFFPTEPLSSLKQVPLVFISNTCIFKVRFHISRKTCDIYLYRNILIWSFECACSCVNIHMHMCAHICKSERITSYLFLFWFLTQILSLACSLSRR